MVRAIDPQIGETVLDPCCGTGGFLAEAHEYMRPKASPLQLENLAAETFYGREKERLVFPIALANLILHGIETPNIWHGDTLMKRVEYGDLFENAPNRFRIALTNPPFGGKVNREVKAEYRCNTTSTQALFVLEILDALQEGGRCGIVLDEGFLFGLDALLQIKRRLLSEFDLRAIVSLPPGVFAQAGTGVKTNLLFFTKGKPTEKIWYYELKPPPWKDRRTGKMRPGTRFTVGYPLTIDHFAEFFACCQNAATARAVGRSIFPRANSKPKSKRARTASRPTKSPRKSIPTSGKSPNCARKTAPRRHNRRVGIGNQIGAQSRKRRAQKSRGDRKRCLRLESREPQRARRARQSNARTTDRRNRARQPRNRRRLKAHASAALETQRRPMRATPHNTRPMLTKWRAVTLSPKKSPPPTRPRTAKNNRLRSCAPRRSASPRRSSNNNKTPTPPSPHTTTRRKAPPTERDASPPQAPSPKKQQRRQTQKHASGVKRRHPQFARTATQRRRVSRPHRRSKNHPRIAAPISSRRLAARARKPQNPPRRNRAAKPLAGDNPLARKRREQQSENRTRRRHQQQIDGGLVCAAK